MKPSTSGFLGVILITLPLHTLLIHWFWSSWVATLLGRIANMMYEQKEKK